MTSIRLPILAMMFTLAAVAPGTDAAVFNWTGASGTDLLWSDAGNWTAGGPPGLVDTAVFGTAATVSAPGSANADNIVSVSKTIQSLQYTNAVGATYHNTVINSGITLTVSNAASGSTLFDGGGINVAVTNTISGVGGTLMVTNLAGTISIRNAGSSGAAPVPQQAALDISGLDTFNAYIGQLFVAGDGSSGNNVSREVGVLFLAKTNIIAIASGTAPALNIADNPSNGEGSGNSPTNLLSVLYLGITNAIYADTITVGRSKCAGQMSFNPAFVGVNTPAAYIRGYSSSRVATFSIGDDSAQTTSNQGEQGAVDFTGGTVDAMIGVNYVGRSPNGSGNAAGTATGMLTIGAGKYNVNTLEVGYQSASTASPTAGTLNLNGGTLTVNALLELAHYISGTAIPTGTFNANGGNIFANKIISGGGTSAMAINNVTLVVTNTVGSPSAPIGTFSITNSTLQLSPSFGATNVVVSTFNIGASVNTINIASLPGIPSYPATFPLIQSTTPNGSLTEFALGTVPTVVPAYQGYVTNDGVGQVYLVLTTGVTGTPPPAPKADVWNGIVSGVANGNWDITTTNWISSGVPTNYVNVTTTGIGDAVTFDDTLTGTTNVNVTTVITPASLTFNNSVSNYVFSGTGKISGIAGLVMEGAASVTLAETGGDDFSGGILVSNGLLTLDNAGSAISGVTTIASNAVMQIGNNDAKGGVPTGAFTNNGTLVLDRSDSGLTVSAVMYGTGGLTVAGSGTVTITPAEHFTGPVLVTNGTLVAAVAQTSTLSPSSSLTIGGSGTVLVNGDNALENNNGTVPITLNAGGTLTGSAAMSTHLQGPLTLNGGTLAVQGTQPQGNQAVNGTWDLGGGVTVGNPPSPITSVISCQYVVPSQANGTAFNITNGSTPSGIDLNVTGSLVKGTGTSVTETGIILNGNGTMQLCSANNFAGGATLNGGVLLLDNSNAVENSTVTLNANNSLQFAAGISTFNLGGLAGPNSFALTSTNGGAVTIKVGSNTANTSYSGILSGNGGFNKTGIGTLTLSGTNTYTGNTTVSGGTLALSGFTDVTNSPAITISSNATLDVSGRYDQTLTINGGETLIGSGTLNNGSLTNNPGSILSFGSAAVMGTLNVTLEASLGGATTMKLNAGTGISDQLDASTITYGGTLTVTNISGAFTDGETFQLFTASSGISGSFANVILPTAPGLTWTNNLAVNGTISAAVAAGPPAIASVSLSGTNLVISGTGGTAGGTYEVLTATNLTLPMSLWITNVSSFFDGSGDFSATNAVSPTTPQQFYRVKTP